jgi:Ca2+-binding RTX toxin-like protein
MTEITLQNGYTDQSRINQLQIIYNKQIANPSLDFRANYYTLLKSFGIGYGELALGVVNSNSFSGQVANNFLSFDKTTLSEAQKIALSKDLFLRDFEKRKANLESAINKGQDRIGDLSIQDQQENHGIVYAKYKVSLESWTPEIPIKILGYEAGEILFDSSSSAFTKLDKLAKLASEKGKLDNSELLTWFGKTTVASANTEEGAMVILALSSIYPLRYLLSLRSLILRSDTLTKYCFTGETPILMSDGTYKPIEKIRIGDEVMAFDGLGELQPRKVIQTFVTLDQEVVQLGDIKVTQGHHFLQPDGSFKALGEIDRNGFLVGVTGKLIPHPGIKSVEGKHTVYNFTVEDLHTYIAGDYRVHNDSISNYQPVTTGGLFGAAIGSQIGSLFADDQFASQLVAQSLGKYTFGLVGDAIDYTFDITNRPKDTSLSLAALYKRLPGSFISTGISLGSTKLSNSLIKTFKIEDPLTQIGVSTLVAGTVSYEITRQVAFLSPDIAVKFFGAPTYINEAGHLVDKAGNLIPKGGMPEVNFDQLSLTGTLAHIGASAFGSFVGSQLYQTSIQKWNILSEDFSAKGAGIGGAIGSLAAGLTGALGTGVATTTIASSLGTWLGAGAFAAGPVGFLVLAAGGTLLGSIIGGTFGDKDYPRSGYVVHIINGSFVSNFGFELDKGNAGIAQAMGNTAKDILNALSLSIGGKVFATGDIYKDNFYYGHYLKEYFYKKQDSAPGASDRGWYPYLSNSFQNAIVAGVIQQIRSTQIEGGDLYVKRILSALPSDVKTLEQLNATFQVAREWGIYRDNSVLYQQNIDDLKANAIKDADAKIIDLRSHPTDAFDPKSQSRYFGNALKFDGNDYVSFQSSAAPTGNQSYTIEAWVKPDKVGNLGIVGWGTYGKSNAVNGLRLDANGIRNYWWDNDLQANIKVSLNEWHHIAATYDNATGIRKIYLDGQKVAEDKPTGHNVTTNSNFTIGKTFDQEYFSGQIDDVRVWNLARTDDEIAAQIIRQLKGNETGLVGYWNLNEGKGTTVQDLTASNKLGVIQGANWVAYDPKLRDFGINILPSQIQLSLQGNNLILNGEIIPNWLTASDRLETLRFADGSRFKIVASNGKVKLDDERVANWEVIKAKAIQLNLDTAKPSDNYLSPNVSIITNLGLGNLGDDVLISKFSSQTLSGGKGDDIYRYNRGQGTIYINDVGGLDTLEFDASIKSSEDLLVQQSGIDLILALKNPANSSATVAQLTDKVVISNFFNQKIEVIRFGNNQKVAIESLQPSFSVNGTLQKVTTVSSSSLYYLTSATTWNNAQAQAKAMGGNLVTINSQAEQDFLISKFGTNEHFWIGLNDVKQEGKFEWVSGEPVTYTNWTPGEPNNASNEDYVHLSKFSNGRWNDLDERYYPNGFDGRAIKGIVEVPSPNDVIFSDSVYYLTNASSWTKAQAQAQAMGGNLVTINSKAEQDVLFATFGKNESFWIGLNDAKQEGKFEWVSGDPVTYTNWAAGEPNNHGGTEDYALMWNARGGLWNDSNENSNFRGIVEVNRLFTGNDKDNLYQYRLGDGNEVIYDIGSYEGITRDGGLDTLEFGKGITPNSLKLTLDNSNLIVKVNDTGTIIIRDWIKAQSKIEIFRFADSKEYNPVLSLDGKVSLQAAFAPGDPAYSLAIDKPSIYANSPYNLLVVDLAGDGLQLISAQESLTLSDPDNDTYLEQTGWVAPADGFLVLDRNNDGLISGLNEFFSLQKQSNVSFLGDIDSNKDLIIDSKDSAFSQLRIWTDTNLNGEVELGELSALYRYGINSIFTIPQSKNYNVAGNNISASAYFTRIGFETKPVSQVYDVSFTYKKDGLKIEQLGSGVIRFNYENKPDIIFADDSGQNINLTIDPNEIASATGGTGADTLIVKPGSAKGAILSGGDGNDILKGSDGADTISDGSGNDNAYGGDGDDIFIKGDGDDFIDGGPKTDVVILQGKFTEYKFEFSPSGTVTVIDRVQNRNGKVTITNCELITFSDRTFRISELKDFEQFYRLVHKDVDNEVRAGLLNSGLHHYELYGKYEGRLTSNDFNEQFYRLISPDVDASIKAGVIPSAIYHYINWGYAEKRATSFQFNEQFYRLIYPSIDAAIKAGTQSSALQHYINHGYAEGRITSLSFDEQYYRSNNPDVDRDIKAGILQSAIYHYVNWGYREGRAAQFNAPNSNASLWGTSNSDILQGSNGNNYLNGGSGNDKLMGLDGNDTLVGGLGNDILDGGNGIDTAVYTGKFNEYHVVFYSDFTHVSDTASNRDDTDTLLSVENVQFSDKTLSLSQIRDMGARFSGLDGNDVVTGGKGNDIYIRGNAGNDKLYGLEGNDNLFGNDGNDILVGGVGADNLTGGAGADRFLYPNFADSLLSALDHITDFNPTEGDRIALKSLPTGVFNAGVFSNSTLSGAIAAAYADVNPNLAGNQALGANQVVFFGWNGGKYVSVNDGLAPSNANTDLVINVTGMTGTMATGALTPTNYFAV